MTDPRLSTNIVEIYRRGHYKPAEAPCQLAHWTGGGQRDGFLHGTRFVPVSHILPLMPHHIATSHGTPRTSLPQAAVAVATLTQPGDAVMPSTPHRAYDPHAWSTAGRTPVRAPLRNLRPRQHQRTMRRLVIGLVIGALLTLALVAALMPKTATDLGTGRPVPTAMSEFANPVTGDVARPVIEGGD